MHAHKCGRWAWKYRTPDGRRHTAYFAPWCSPDEALAEWRATARSLERGDRRDPDDRRVYERSTLRVVARAFLGVIRERVELGEIGWDTFRDCRSTVQWLVRAIDPSLRVDQLEPGDFRAAKRTLKGASLHTIKKRVITTRWMFAWAHDEHNVPVPRYGRYFSTPTQRRMRRARRDRAPEPYTPAEVRALIAHASPRLRAPIMLAINGGMRASDLAALDVRDVELGEAGLVAPAVGRIDTHRAKTEAPLRVPLWPETVAAILAHPSRGASPSDPLLTTRTGARLARISDDARHRTDTVALMFSRGLLRRLSTPDPEDPSRVIPMRGSFGLLRSTFDTIAAETTDDTARKVIMGHTIDRMDETYIKRLAWSRLEAVTEHVRRWLYGVDAGPAAASWMGHCPVTRPDALPRQGARRGPSGRGAR
jgi:integrase